MVYVCVCVCLFVFFSISRSLVFNFCKSEAYSQSTYDSYDSYVVLKSLSKTFIFSFSYMKLSLSIEQLNYLENGRVVGKHIYVCI